jgi:hypothetical protein
MEKETNTYSFLEEIPSFKKFDIESNSNIELIHTIIASYTIAKKFEDHSIFENTEKNQGAFLFYKGENTVLIEYTIDKNEINITSCHFSKQSSPELFEEAVKKISEKEFQNQSIIIKISPFDINAGKFFSDAAFSFETEYILNKRIKLKEDFFQLYFEKKLHNDTKNVFLMKK